MSTHFCLCSSSSFTASTWYHLVASKVGSTVTFYKNGVSIGSAASITVFNGAANLTIGHANNQKDTFTGGVSNSRIYKRGLSSTEVYNNYIADRGRFGL